jgi:hypothetical protein
MVHVVLITVLSDWADGYIVIEECVITDNLA